MDGPHHRHHLVGSDPADPTLEEIIGCSSAPSNHDMSLLGLHHHHHQHADSTIPRYSSPQDSYGFDTTTTTTAATTMIPRPHSMSSLQNSAHDYTDYRRTSDPTGSSTWNPSITPPTFNHDPLFDTWDADTSKTTAYSTHLTADYHTTSPTLDDYHSLLFLRQPPSPLLESPTSYPSPTPPDSPGFHFHPAPEITITTTSSPSTSSSRPYTPPSRPCSIRKHHHTPSTRRKPSNSSINDGISFVNFTPSDATRILSGVAPSGSSKTKARREREAMEKRRKLSEAAAAAVRAAGGDATALAEVDLI